MSKNSILTTKELAEYIKLNEKTIIKMAQQGELPGVKVGNQWRFHLSVIDDYLQGNMGRGFDEKLGSVINRGGEEVILLSRLTNQALISIGVEVKDAGGILTELARIAYRNGLTSSQEELFYELRKREQMLSTAIGNGVAIPHPRHPSSKLFKEPKIIIVRLKKGIDFGAPDGKAVCIFFMICAPTEFIHIRLLAVLSKLLNSPKLKRKFIHAESKGEILKVLLEFDREYLFSQ
jgi:PTS system nitrogen regulatory IIA component